jgi:hypothetical protein
MKPNTICKVIIIAWILTLVGVALLYNSVQKDVLWVDKLDRIVSNQTHTIALVTLSLYTPTGNSVIDETMDCLSANKERYAELHNLEYFDEVYYKENIDLMLPYLPWMILADRRWTKLHYIELLIRFLLKEKYIDYSKDPKWILWSDSDILFTNPIVSPEERLNLFLEEHKLRNGPDVILPTMIVAQDHNAINIGMFFIRVSLEGLALVQRIWTTPLTSKNRHWADNSVFINMMEQDIYMRKQVFVIPYQQQRNLQSYPNTEYSNSMWQNGDWIVHFAGYGRIATSALVETKFKMLVCNEL